MTDNKLSAELQVIFHNSRRFHFWRGLALTWVIVGAAAWLFTWLYWKTGWRSGFTLPALAFGSLVSALVLLWRSRKRAVDFHRLAQDIEQQHPKLQALLLTAVDQFKTTPPEGFNYFQQRIIREALEHNSRYEWAQHSLQRLVVSHGAHALALIFFLVALARVPSSGEAARTFHPFLGVQVNPGHTNVERGSSLVIWARFKGTLPPEATLAVFPSTGVKQTVPLVKNLDDPVFGTTLPSVNSEFTYQVEFNGKRTPPYRVRVFDFPNLERANVQLHYPAYTQLPPKKIEDTRRVSAVEGTDLEYSFHLNKAVKKAELLESGGAPVTLQRDSVSSNVYNARIKLDRSHKFELRLMDSDGRTNRHAPEFVFEALTNKTPELKWIFPRGDQRVSALEEMNFQAEASDDFGLLGYGFAYSLSGAEPSYVELGRNSGPLEKKAVQRVVSLESLGAKPEQLLSYFLWAEDLGPDGKPRRTVGDLFFAEVRPFEEIFRENQMSSNQRQSQQQGGAGGESQKLAELEKQIITATWNLQRSAPKEPAGGIKKKAAIIHESQEAALEQLNQMKERLTNPRLKPLVDEAEKEMTKASEQLKEAVNRSSAAPLTSALPPEQAAYQRLLRLGGREFQVAQGRSGGQSSGSAAARQAQIDQLQLKQADQRYETERQASAAQTPEQRAQLEVLNRLRDLAQRQEDLNDRLQELQTALMEAKTPSDRAEIERRLKRLRDEERELVQQLDELRQQASKNNSQKLAEAMNRLDRTREDLRKAADALEQNKVSPALASGRRAQEELQQLRQDFRKAASSQFAQDMRQMRRDARELAQKNEEMRNQLGEVNQPNRKSLSNPDAPNFAESTEAQQKQLAEIKKEMRQVIEQSETAEPLLSKKLYDTLRKTEQSEVDKMLDATRELARRGIYQRAGEASARAGQAIDNLKTGVEEAAETILGDEREALRFAKSELDDLAKQLEKENAAASNGGTNQTAQTTSSENSRTNQTASASPEGSGSPSQSRNQSGNRDGQSPAGGQNQPGDQARSQGQQGNQPGEQAQSAQSQNGGQSQSQNGQPGAGQGSRGQSAQANNRGNGAPGQQGGNRAGQANAGQNRSNQSGRGNSGLAQRGQNPGQNPGRAGGNPRTGGERFFDGGLEAGGGGGGGGPITTTEFRRWSDRLSDVTEMLESPTLRAQADQIRERVRGFRMEYKNHSQPPTWDLVESQALRPLTELRDLVQQELARKDSRDALVPIDRDPVPQKFTELVRRYYEKLGEGE